MGHGRQHGLGAHARITAPDAAHVQAGPDGRALQGCIAFFTLYFLDIQELLVFFHIEGCPVQKGPVFGRQFHHIVVETGNGDTTVGVMKAGDEGAEFVDGIGHGAAVMA